MKPASKFIRCSPDCAAHRDEGGMIRPPAVAGKFYPADPAELRRTIRDYLASAKKSTGASPKAIIAPHAGYIYSGPVAASAYVHWIDGSDAIRRVILLGPSHHVPFQGVAITQANEFATPLGRIPVDEEATDLIRSLPQVHVLDAAHEHEHSLEVHLPFLQNVLIDFTLVPLVVGEAEAEEISEVIETLWDGPETRIVVSSDLSHYHDYETARKQDRATARAIEALRPEDIEVKDACGCLPIRGLLRMARRRGLRARMVDLRNSGDTAGTRDRVVGYGAFVFTDD